VAVTAFIPVPVERDRCHGLEPREPIFFAGGLAWEVVQVQRATRNSGCTVPSVFNLKLACSFHCNKQLGEAVNVRGLPFWTAEDDTEFDE
jgi:hypothetical protein